MMRDIVRNQLLLDVHLPVTSYKLIRIRQYEKMYHFTCSENANASMSYTLWQHYALARNVQNKVRFGSGP